MENTGSRELPNNGGRTSDIDGDLPNPTSKLTQRPCRTHTARKREAKQQIPARLIKTQQAAIYLCISPWKLRRIVQDGLLPVIMGDGTAPWLFDIRDLDCFIERTKVTL